MSPPPPSHHHYSHSHPPTTSAKRHVKCFSDCPSASRLPLTPPLTPSSSINNNNPADPSAIVAASANDTRIIRLSNLDPTLDPSLLERTILQILSSTSSSNPPAQKIKGLNTRILPSTHAVPVVFFDPRDARTLLDSVNEETASGLDALALPGERKVAAYMISLDQLINDLGPSPFLDSIDPSFHLRVSPVQPHETPAKNLNLPMLQSLLLSIGELCTFTPEYLPHESENQTTVVYHIEYFDSRDADRAMLELDDKVLFGMRLAVVPVANRSECIARQLRQEDHDDWDESGNEDDQSPVQAETKRKEGGQILNNVEFPSISTSASASMDTNEDADTLEKCEAVDSIHRGSHPYGIDGPGTAELVIGPPGLASNLRVRFQSLGFGQVGKEKCQVQKMDAEAEDWDLDAAPVDVRASNSGVHQAETKSESDGEVEAKPMVLYASSPAVSASLRSDDERRVPHDVPSGACAPGLGSAAATGMDASPLHALDTSTTPKMAATSTTTIPWDEVGPTTTSGTAQATGPQLGLEVTTLGATTGATRDEASCYGDSPDGVCFYCPCPSRFASPPTSASSVEVGYQAHSHGHHLQAPPTPTGTHQGALIPSYGHYAVPPPTNLNAGEPAIPPPPGSPDSGLVYYPSLSATPTPTPTGITTPIMTPGGYEYFDAHYGVMQAHGHPGGIGLSLPGSPAPQGVGWGGYDASMMMPLPVGVSMNMGMGMMHLPMGLNMHMGVGMNMGMIPPPPPPHGYYPMPRADESGRGGAGRYVGPYTHPHPQLQYGVGASGNVNAHQQQYQIFQNQRLAGSEGLSTPSTSGSGSGSSVGSSCQSTGSGGGGRINGIGNGSYAYRQQGRGSPPPVLGTGAGAGRLGLGRVSLRGFGYKEREREGKRERVCVNEQHHQGRRGGRPSSRERKDSGESSPAPAQTLALQATTSLLGVHYDNDTTTTTPPLHITGPGDTSTSTTPTTGTGTVPTERNQLNIKRIEDGVDTRTTVMIKNIPNKMSDRDLMAFIERVCPRRIDFFYLRMDFQNGCNVGYAFVNFIHVQDLLRFAKARLGVKWNMFSSEKVLQMSYANYQGKEALVEKFKNSAIMDEREAWRPRIFYSSGSNQGLPEPFPPPTHMRRKERSFFNRGALFVPGGERVSATAGNGGEGRRGVRGGVSGNGSDSEVLTMKSLSGGGAFGKGWMGRTTRRNGGSEEEGEGFRGV